KRATILLPLRAAAVLAAVGLGGGVAYADEGGISFWLPGLYGSFAAVPTTPGLSWANIYIRPSASAGATQPFPPGNGQVDLGIDGNGDLLAFGPTYTFAERFFGAQVGVSLVGLAGRNTGSAQLTLTGPNGGVISGARADTAVGFGDLLPQVTMKWN